MIAAWLGIALLLQAAPVPPQQGGTITGVLRDAEGIPFPGVRLEPVSLLPAGIRTPRAPGPAGTHAPGTAIPLATLHGTITDKETKQPIASGSAFITANGVALDMLDAAGKFAFPGLLPGSYSLEIRLVDHAVEPRTIVIGDENMEVEVAAEKPKD